ncbi:hypothetical protein AAFF_G00126920 [Aldrovandia affinis]|uniref:Neuferricin n=1 Tax=Aldrovandia affinis TaxID=143900 RepID=A0AAD7T2R8_9TELE|nr:hypothetical protein AAFF_G00126920 [Aldrovandia affinis]
MPNRDRSNCYRIRRNIRQVGTPKEEIRLLRENDLSSYNGESKSQRLYLSILGQVFDVSKGLKHYGPGGGYHFFAGKDASRAFVTGDFSETGQTDDLSGLSPTQIVALFDWLDFYQKDYEPVGRLIGRYYSESGEATAALRQVEAMLAEGKKLKAQAQAESKRVSPPATLHGVLTAVEEYGAPQGVVGCTGAGRASQGNSSPPEAVAPAAFVCKARTPRC